MTLLRELGRRRSRTTLTLLGTHDPMVAAATDRTILMRDGRIHDGAALAVAA